MYARTSFFRVLLKGLSVINGQMASSLPVPPVQGLVVGQVVGLSSSCDVVFVQALQTAQSRWARCDNPMILGCRGHTALRIRRRDGSGARERWGTSASSGTWAGCCRSRAAWQKLGGGVAEIQGIAPGLCGMNGLPRLPAARPRVQEGGRVGAQARLFPYLRELLRDNPATTATATARQS